jgi:hypothetical protein
MTRSEHADTTIDMFGGEGRERSFAPGALLLAGFAGSVEAPLLAGLHDVVAAAPFRQLGTPGGQRINLTFRKAT